MKTAVQIFLKQTCRNTKRLVLQLLLLCAAVMFFIVSVNLFANSKQNLLAVENTYTSIATMEIYGYVNESGELVHPGDTSVVGRHWLSVEDYDLSPLLALDCVKDIQLRTRVGAYIPGHIQVYYAQEDQPLMVPEDCYVLFGTTNVIRFVLGQDAPLTLSLTGEDPSYIPFPIRVIASSNPLLQLPEQFALNTFDLSQEDLTQWADELRRLNGSDVTDSITLYPGVEYVLAGRGGDYWKRDAETGVYTWYEDD